MLMGGEFRACRVMEGYGIETPILPAGLKQMKRLYLVNYLPYLVQQDTLLRRNPYLNFVNNDGDLVCRLFPLAFSMPIQSLAIVRGYGCRGAPERQLLERAR